MAARLTSSVSSGSSSPAQAAMANEAVAIAFVEGLASARETEGGSHMLVRRSGEPGTWRERSFWASWVEVWGLKGMVAMLMVFGDGVDFCWTFWSVERIYISLSYQH